MVLAEAEEPRHPGHQCGADSGVEVSLSEERGNGGPDAIHPGGDTGIHRLPRLRRLLSRHQGPLKLEEGGALLERVDHRGRNVRTVHHRRHGLGLVRRGVLVERQAAAILAGNGDPLGDHDAVPEPSGKCLNVVRFQLEDGGHGRRGGHRICLPGPGVEPARVLIEVVELLAVDRVQAVEALKEGRLAGLVLPDQGGHVRLDRHRARVVEVAELLNAGLYQPHVVPRRRCRWACPACCSWSKEPHRACRQGPPGSSAISWTLPAMSPSENSGVTDRDFRCHLPR